jgi:hypothetical protein
MVDAAIQISELGSFGKGALHNILSKGRIRVEYQLWQEDFTKIIKLKLSRLCGNNMYLFLAVTVQNSDTCGYIIPSILIQHLGEVISVTEEVVKAVAASGNRLYEDVPA